MKRTQIIFSLKLVLLVAVSLTLLLPIFSNPNETGVNSFADCSLWHVDAALTLEAAILLLYGFLGICGFVLIRNELGYRIGIMDLLLIGAFPLYILFIGNDTYLGATDTVSIRAVPSAILTRGTFDLSGFQRSGESLHESFVNVKGRILPSFPLGTALLALPHARLALFLSNGAVNGQLLMIREKHFAALLSVASACLLFIAIRRRFGEAAAIAAAILFAAGTTVFTCASQATWSFTGEVFCVCLALSVLLPESRSRPQIILAGLALGGAFLCRPTAVLILTVFFVLLFLQSRKEAYLFGFIALLSVVSGMIFYYVLYGHPLGGWGIFNQSGIRWQFNKWLAFSGNLVSPSRGILVYFPVLACVLLAVVLRRISIHEYRNWFYGSLTIVIANYFLISMYGNWWGGWSIGPRLMTESAPFLVLLTVPLYLQWTKLGWLRPLVIACFLFSILTQSLGAYNPAAHSWSAQVQVDKHPKILWSWKNSQLAATWIPGWDFQPRIPGIKGGLLNDGPSVPRALQ